MAEAGDRAGSVDKSNKHVNLQQKRKSDQTFEGQESSQVKKQKDAKEGIKGKDEGKLPVKKPFAMGISMNLSGPKKSGPIKMTMPSQVQDKKDSRPLLPKSGKVASVFNEDSESDEEEMPPEAKMRMRNVGRETPTAAGPNSFGKGNLGFCDRNKMIERELKKQMQEYGEKADIDKLDKT